jgi:hypothetical protein
MTRLVILDNEAVQALQDPAHASTAAAIRNQTGVSVADAHLGAVIQSAPADQVTVVTSEPGDMRLVAGDRKITVAAI